METFLIAVTLRPLVVAALVGLSLARVRSAAILHAAWTLVTASMLAMAIAVAVLPAVPVRILAPAPRPVAMAGAVAVYAIAAPLPKPQIPWIATLYSAGLLVMALRLAYGYRLTRKLLRDSRPIPRFASEPVHESTRVSIPLTVGWLRPRILVPAGWDAWTPEKLEAVLVHERNHIQRRDWAVAVLASVNRCVFWFHPLAWWLEARLKVLAEEACDDACLQHVTSRESYAQVLVEMAAAVRSDTGRAIAMAKGGDVSMRVERILDEMRTIGPGMTGRRWAAMALCALPVMYLAAVARPARLRAQDPPATPAAAAQTAPQVEAPQPKTSNPLARPISEELERIDAEITKFKSENMGRLPEQFQANVVELNSMQIMLGQANEALSHLQQQRLLLETRLQNLNAQLRFQSAPNPMAQQQAEERIHDLRAQLEGLKENLTPQHPSVKRLEDQIALAAKARAAVGTYEDSQNQKRMLDLEGEINMVKTEMQNVNLQMDEQVRKQSEIQRQIAAYQMRIESSPELGARYAELLREREIALQRLAGAEAPSGSSVKLRVTFGADGRPHNIHVMNSQGLKEDEQALEWVKSLRFTPPRRDGQEAPGEVTLEVSFPVK